MQRQKNDYKGDPVEDFSQISFLDRFVFKNPKQPKKETNPMAPPTVRKSLRLPRITALDFLQRSSIESIPEDERFFHKYFEQREKLHPRPEKEKHKDQDIGDIPDEELLKELEAEEQREKKDKTKKEKPQKDEVEEGSGEEFNYEDLLKDDGEDEEIEPDFDIFDAEGQLENGEMDGGNEEENMEGDMEDGDMNGDMDGEEDMMAELDEIDVKETGGKRQRKSLFADAADFEEILSQAGKSKENPKQSAWDEKIDGFKNNNKKKKGKKFRK